MEARSVIECEKGSKLLTNLMRSLIMSIAALYVVKRYVPDDHKGISNPNNTDYFGIVAGAVGLILLSLPPRFVIGHPY